MAFTLGQQLRIFRRVAARNKNKINFQTYVKRSTSSQKSKFYQSTLLIRRENGNRIQEEQWYEQSQDQGISDIQINLQNKLTIDSLPAVPKIIEWWDTVPARWKLIYTITLSFVLCNMDKVNMSVAIIPMAKEFGWTSSLIGSVSGFFFYGYMLAQYPGGLLARKLGGQQVLPLGVGLWSLSTVAVPLMAGAVPSLFLSRALVGLGEAVAPSAQNDIVAKLVPQEERARANSTIFSGLYLGSIIGLFVAPKLIETFDWPSVFYVFGGAGLFWCILWEYILTRLNESEPQMMVKLGVQNQSGSGSFMSGLKQMFTDVPLKAFVSERSVQALLYVHFCNNWFHYTFLSWLPKYFTDTLDSNLSIAAFFATLPNIAALTFSFVVGPSADYLISKNVPVTRVRKLFQSISFLGPLGCLAGVWQAEGEVYQTVGCITLAFGLGSFVLAGLYCNHQDISPKYSQVLLGLTNTLGAVPGVFGAALTGILMDQYGDYNVALLLPAMFFFLSGTIVYLLFGCAETVDFDAKQQQILQQQIQK